MFDDLRLLDTAPGETSANVAPQRTGTIPISRVGAPAGSGYAWPGFSASPHLTSSTGVSLQGDGVLAEPSTSDTPLWSEPDAAVGKGSSDAGPPHTAFFELDDPDFCTTETLLNSAPFVSGISPLPDGATIPYPLCTAEQYAHVIATSALWSSNFVLMADIDLGALSPPPSTTGVQLSGVFDGNNKTLSNYTFSSTTDAVSLFGKLNPTGVIRNLVVRDFNISGFNRVAALVHENRGLIEHVTAINVTASGSTGGGVNLGIAGIAAVNYGTLGDVTASVNITGAPDAFSIGGLVGRQGRTSLELVGHMTDCNVSGIVTRLEAEPGMDIGNIGGAVGLMEEGSIVNTHSSVIVVSSIGRAGGLAGRSHGPIVASSATGSVTSSGGPSVGGLVGTNTGVIQESFSTSNVSGTAYVGGLVGLADGNSNISDSYATGNVQGTGDEVGGLCGRSDGAISTSYASGNVQGADSVGGLVGYLRQATSSVSESWASGSVSATGGSAGGLVGIAAGQVNASYARGDVTGLSQVGGLVGRLVENSSLQDCAATGNTVTGTGSVGGLIGHLEGHANRCFATATVAGVSRVGGLVGDQIGDVSDSYATGAVTASGSLAGGLVGRIRLTATVVRAYSAGAVTGPAPIGGFAGEMLDTSLLEDCHFNTTENPGLNAVGNNPSATGVIGNSAGDLRQEGTFTPAWDFEDVWGILEDYSFPFLQPVPSCTDGGCGLGCPCPPDTCDNESDCAVGQVCGEANGGYFEEEPDADVCWDPLCETDQRQQLCDAEGAPCGECGPEDIGCSSDADCEEGQVCGEENGGYFGLESDSRVCWDPLCESPARLSNCGVEHELCGLCSIPGCTSDADCPNGQVCGIGAGLLFDYTTVNVCWDAICETAQEDNCGAGGLCGICTCTPDCSGKTCGDDPSDGCGGVCRGFCDNREGGCNANYECPVGSVCMPEAGDRIGLPAGTNVCLPEECADNDLSAMDCGVPSATCGECPECASACEGRACGPDPAGCAVDCGTCATGSCIDGQCIDFTATSLVIPDVDGTPVEVDSLPDAATEEIGATEANFAVNERGAATYEVPIEVPPGRAGLEPDLSVRYASTASNGYLGIGWSIEGLSQITRCNTNRRFDGWPGPVRMDDSDRFCLDGRRLIAEADYGANGTEYYVEPENFSKVVSNGRSGLGPESFKVWTREGRILYYGGTVGARQQGLTGTVRTWYLSRIEDRAGNIIDISYKRHGASPTWGSTGSCTIVTPTSDVWTWELQCEDPEIAPDRIHYGGFSQNGVNLPHSREIIFHYSEADRPDKLDGYLPGGGRVQRTKLLERIETRVRGQHVRSYRFSYNNDDWDASLLRELRECAGEGAGEKCKPPTTFDYHGAGAGAFEPPQHTGYQVAKLEDGHVSYSWFVLDMNGDGRDDLLISHGVESGSPPWIAYISDPRAGERVFYEMETDTFASMKDPDDPRLLAGRTIAFPGDARRDMYAWPIQVSGGHYRIAQVTDITYPASPTERGSLTFSQQALERVNINNRGPFFYDIDGDGYEDPIWCDLTGDSYVFEPRIDGEFALRGEPSSLIGLPHQSCGASAIGLDLDGDGLPNMVRREATSRGGPDPKANWRALFTTGYDATTNTVDGEWAPVEIGDGIYVGIDANGDGLQDVLHQPSEVSKHEGPGQGYVNLAFRVDLYINTGRGQLVPSGRFLEMNDEEFLTSKVIDYNGDGFDDLLYPAPPGLAALDEWVVAYGGPVPFQMAHYPLDLGVSRPTVDIGVKLYEYRAISRMAEVNGDSASDLVMVDAEGKLVVLFGRMGRANLLKQVTDGLGRRYDIEYEAEVFTEGRTYTVGSECTTSAMCVSDPGPLVSSYTVSQAKGIAADDATVPPLLGETPTRRERIFRFRYADARRDGQGYGWLGFGSRTISELDGLGNPIRDTHILYHNEPGNALGVSAYALVGKPKEITTTTSAASSSLETIGPHAERTRVTNTWLFKPGRFVGQSFPYVRSRRTDVFDISYQSDSETPIHRIYESFDVDEYGNQVSYLRQEGRPESELLLAEREVTTVPRPADEESWLVALPQSISIRDWIYPRFDEHTRTTEFVYYDTGLLQNVIREPHDAYYRLTTTFGRDAYNNVDLLTIADADADIPHRQTTLSYDEDQVFPTEITNSLGHTTRVIHDARFGVPSLMADPNNVVQKFSYDGFGRLRVAQTPGETTTVSFNDYDLQMGEPVPVRGAMAIERTTDGGLRQTTVVDSFGRPVEVQSSGLQGARVDQEIAYGPAGLPVLAARPHDATDATSQGVIEYTYDLRHRLIAESHPDDTVIEYAYANRASLIQDELGIDQHVTALHYRSTKDRNDNVTVNAMDFRGNLTVHYYDYFLDERTLYQYSGFGVLSRIEDTFGNVISDVPDRYGRITTQSDPDRGATTYTHTAFGEVATSNDARNVSSEYIYDALGRPRFLTNSRDGVVQWAYDGNDGSGGQPNAVGRLTYASRDAEGHITRFRYEPYAGVNNRGLLAALDRTINTESGPREFTTSFEYDSASRVDLIHYPAAGSDGATAAPLDIRYHYDTRGNLERVSDDTTGETYWQLINHSQGYRVRQHRLGSNITGTVDYNPLNGTIAAMTYAGAEALDSAVYGYDANRNLTDIAKPNGASSQFSYDNLDRMVGTAITDEADVTQFSEYAYDPIGRLLSKTGVGGYDYDDGDHPHAVQNAGDYSFDYEQNGNTITRRRSDGQAVHLQYMGAFGLPHRIDRIAPGEDSGPWTELEYDAFGGRVVKRELAADGSFETQRLYVGDEFEVTEHADGTIDYVSNLFLGQTQIARILRTETDGDVSAPTVEYLLSDHLGTPSVVASANGTALRSNSFTPYGAPETPELQGPGFTGHRHDLESELVDMRGRLYDPLIARFMSPDPIISDAHLSEGLNPYSYVFNNPMNWVDPSGLEPAPDVGPSDFQLDTIQGPAEVEFNAPLSEQNFGPSADAGTATMPPGGGVWTPGSGQTGDVVPSEDTASFESCPFGRCAGPPQSTNLSVLSEAAGQVDNSAEFWEAALAIATIVTPGPGMGEGLIILSARAARATRVAVTARGAAAAGRGAGVGGGLPGLADLPTGVAVPVRAGQALAIPRALTPREMAALMNTSGNIEFSQTFFQGQYFLTRASHAIPNQVQVLPLRSGVAWISHTHPVGFSGSASAADQAILKLLGQSASRVVRPNGSSVRFGP